MDKLHVWKIAVDPVDSEIIFAGTRPAALFRSKDGGRTWKLDKELGTYYGEMYPSVLPLKDGRLLDRYTAPIAPRPTSDSSASGRSPCRG